MKILYYNWVQFDNNKKFGGGVNVYQKNLIKYLIENSSHDLYFLSSGWKYNPLKIKPYIKKTKNIFNEKCKSYEIINSTIMSPAYVIYMNPNLYSNDDESAFLFDKFLKENGPFDIIHFNNMEGISINVLKLKEKYKNTKFIVSIHNYQTICPLVFYFQFNQKQICNDFKKGNSCRYCLQEKPIYRCYFSRVKNYVNDFSFNDHSIFKLILLALGKIKGIWASKYMGSIKTMKADSYFLYRKHNVEMLNKYSDYILAVSKRVRSIMIDNGILPEKIYTSYIGTEIAENQLNHSVLSKATPFTIAYLGYANIEKGFFFFIDSMSTLIPSIAAKINIVLAVPNIHKKNFEEKLKNFNKVKVYNGYDHKDLHQILSQVNLGVIPVLWEDNLPQVSIEMVACGVPILCSSFGGASELCNSELFIFKGGDKKDFIEKLSKLVLKPKLLEEYWKNHIPLVTMEKHVNELNMFYKGQINMAKL